MEKKKLERQFHHEFQREESLLFTKLKKHEFSC